jgi:hypothetical protein
MSLRVTFGIDPGLTGAIAVLADGEVERIIDMPTMQAGTFREVDAGLLAAYLRGARQRHPGAYFSACLERVGARPGDGGTSAFRFGEGFGKVKSVLEVMCIPFVMPVPAQWKRYYGLIGKEKDESRQLALKRFPCAAHRLQRKKDHGRAEAALLALYHDNTDHAGRNAA